MNFSKQQLVWYHPPQRECPTHPKPELRLATVVDLNEKPAAVKVGKYKIGNVPVGPRRLWIPAAWVES